MMLENCVPKSLGSLPTTPMLGAQAQSQVQGLRKRKLDLKAEVAWAEGRGVREGP